MFFSCSSDDEILTVKINSNPEPITVDDIVLDGATTTIDWSDAKDEDDDQIFYKLYINSILIEETTKSISTTTLAYNTDYIGRIIATDKKGGTTEVSFEFSSSKSKILLYSNGVGALKAVDLHTLTPMWTTQTTSIESHIISGNMIYSGIDGINGLDILSGEIIWTSTPSNNYNRDYRNIIADDLNVYALDAGSNLHCVNKTTGGKMWERSFMDYYAPLSIDLEHIFICSRNNDHLYAINKSTGEADWSFRLESNASKIKTNPLIINNDIYFGDNRGKFYSLNKNTGLKNWSISAPGQYISFDSSPTQFNELIITGTNRALYAYNSITGVSKWQYTLNGNTLKTSPFVYNDKVYIGVSKNGSGELVCLNANDGSVVWRFNLENNTTSSPIVFEDTVYIGDWNKNMYFVNASTGVLITKIKSESIIFKSPSIVVGEGETVIYPSVNGLKN